MIGILIATHGGFAEGLLNAAELIAGKQDKCRTIGLYHGDGIDAFTEKVRTAYEELDEGDGVMVFVDILGGSPSNAVMKLMNDKPEVKAISGVNLPMIIQAFFAREGSTVDELCDLCAEAGQAEQHLLHERFKEMMADANSEDDDEF